MESIFPKKARNGKDSRRHALHRSLGLRPGGDREREVRQISRSEGGERDKETLQGNRHNGHDGPARERTDRGCENPTQSHSGLGHDHVVQLGQEKQSQPSRGHQGAFNFQLGKEYSSCRSGISTFTPNTPFVRTGTIAGTLFVVNLGFSPIVHFLKLWSFSNCGFSSILSNESGDTFPNSNLQ